MIEADTYFPKGGILFVASKMGSLSKISTYIFFNIENKQEGAGHMLPTLIHLWQ